MSYDQQANTCPVWHPPPSPTERTSVSDCVDCREGNLEIRGGAHVSYYHRNLWTDTGTAALGI